MTHLAARPNSKSRFGFTMIEAAISIALTALVIVSALNLLAMTTRARRTGSDRDRAFELGHALIAEITAQRVEEPDDPVAFGHKGAESAGSRALWDDMDDYDDWTGAPPLHKDGTAVAGGLGWQRSVTVEKVSPGSLGGVSDTSGTPLRLVTVTVVSPLGEPVVFETLRSAGGSLEQPPPVETTYVTRVGVTLDLVGGAAAPETDAAALINHVLATP